ncbi:hypothetical protein CVT24_012699 [Panaeolus cyanescens]|uniref:Uncharacterized protein n=1 Tax=Panaeolus cyanescens TaxID=181874 RepID=A0A409YK70_9AGAR|nr:hypothetical protein CVT24_012699 [Panaeolus cyanescens]
MSSPSSPPYSEVSFTINDLPPEILAKIFHAHMFHTDKSDAAVTNGDDDEIWFPVFIPHPPFAPLLFSRVCSYWRNVSISTPVLWSAIAIRCAFNLQTVSLWLERSQHCPLTLLVDLDDEPRRKATSEFSPTVIQRLLETLYKTIPRWKRVSLHLPKATYIQNALFALIPEEGKSPAILLEYLHFSSKTPRLELDPDILSPQSLARLSSFPHRTLTHLRWPGNNCVTMPNTSLVANLATSFWANLQQMSFTFVALEHLLTFLKSCPRLNVINVRSLLAHYDVHVPSKIVADNLHVLRIAILHGELSKLTKNLATPRLKGLDIGFPFNHGDSFILQEFLDGSGCKLEHLCIGCSRSGPDAEIQTMLHLPTFAKIPNLSMQLSSLSPKFMKKFKEEWAVHKPTAYIRHAESSNNNDYRLGWGTSLNAIPSTLATHPNYPLIVYNPRPRARKP